ncbi:hypothetical protein ABT147_31270 [Streptomyces sp. NPDC001868]|uniref:hypothetical protein n=1 Tax=Streptomyces sp. NPDC001868 TaxID=3154401 RepID=UPI00331F278D
MPITAPVPGTGVGSGKTANAMCHCPLRKVTRKPSCTCFLRQVGSPNPDVNLTLLALAKSFSACCCTSAFPEPSHSLSHRATVS